MTDVPFSPFARRTIDEFDFNLLVPLTPALARVLGPAPVRYRIGVRVGALTMTQIEYTRGVFCRYELGTDAAVVFGERDGCIHRLPLHQVFLDCNTRHGCIMGEYAAGAAMDGWTEAACTRLATRVEKAGSAVDLTKEAYILALSLSMLFDENEQATEASDE